MDDGAAAQHIALLARTGLMTHVALLEAPVTAEAVRRFREEAAAQATNVMAVGAGRFALCLPQGRREIATGVPHRLHAIGQDGGRPADAPLTLTAPAPTAPVPTQVPTPVPTPAVAPPAPPAPATTARPPAADGRAVLAALVEGQGAIAAGLDRLARDVATARSGQETALAEAVERGLARALSTPQAVPPEPDPGRMRADRMDRLAAETHAAQTATATALREVLAAIETLAGRVRALEAAPPPAGTLPDPVPPPAPRPPATVTPLHAAGAAPVAPTETPQPTRSLPEGLDTMLQTILARLAHVAREDAPMGSPGPSTRAAPPPAAPAPPAGGGQHDALPPWQRAGSQRP